jgi:hypothetical protein
MSDQTTAPDAELRRHLAGPAGDWVAAAGAAAGGHPGVEELIAYHGGGLDEDDQRRIQDHLVTCRDCLDHLLELEEFAGAVGAGERAEGEAVRAREPARDGGAADFETAAAWRAMRSRLPADEPVRLPRWAGALAAALALAAVGLGLFALGQHRETSALRDRLAELSRPQPGAAIVDLYPPSAVRGAGEGAPAVELPAGRGWATLILHLPDGERYERYEVEIVDSAERTLWSDGAFEASRLYTLRLGLPSGYLPPGEHSLRVYGIAGDRRNPVQSYPVVVPEP